MNYSVIKLSHRNDFFFILLLRGHRVSTVKSFTVDAMVITNIVVTFAPNGVLKHSREVSDLGPFTYSNYDKIKKLLVISCLREYLSRRNVLVDVNVKQLIITTTKTYRNASTYTISRWIKEPFYLSEYC